MTSAQIDLLKRLVEADRFYRSKVQRGEQVFNSVRGVEIGYISGARTAEVLEAAGLIETVAVDAYRVYAYLGKCEPYDEE